MLLNLRSVPTYRIFRFSQLTIVLAVINEVSKRRDATMLKVPKIGAQAGLAQQSLNPDQRCKIRHDLELVIAELDRVGESVAAAHAQMAADLLKPHEPTGRRLK